MCQRCDMSIRAWRRNGAYVQAMDDQLQMDILCAAFGLVALVFATPLARCLRGFYKHNYGWNVREGYLRNFNRLGGAYLLALGLYLIIRRIYGH